MVVLGLILADFSLYYLLVNSGIFIKPKTIPPTLTLPREGGGEGGGDSFSLRLRRAVIREP
jgi:hypothetical protein